MKLEEVSVIEKYSSLKIAGETAFASPPVPEVGSTNSCEVTFPVRGSREKAVA